ncbi:MAG TPA: glutathione S-transferase family protein [Burkholderiales bacterium]|jgi:glutathione S-transferase|nr:glutathione S-transferase family protein [Burkholderiales bacterium]
MNPLILHHYPVSPFAEKVRAMLGFKGLAWKSVLIPMLMPKPDVVALTGGYRRTPILQIGADIYCDTSLIARVLERAAPAPTLFPYGDRLEGRAMSHFADSVLFNITVPVGFQPGGMMKLFHPEMTSETLAEFAKDRAAMRQGGTVRRGPLSECRANMAQLLPAIEAQLAARPFLLGASASECDFSLYHVLWPVWKVPATRPLLEPYPNTMRFIDRMTAFALVTSAEISSEEALQVAKKSKPAAIKHPEAFETDGIALGDPVQVMPVDYGFDPVKGELVHCSPEEIAVRRSDPRAGTVVVHFPRFGYQVSRAA